MTPSLSPVELETHLTILLEPARFEDAAANGWQVEGTRPIRRLVTGVTASLALIQAAVAQEADALLVHHGLFWRGQNPCLRGWLATRLRVLMQHGMHLFAYHLPLDAHPQLGNNAQWARHMGWKVEGVFGRQNLACRGTVDYYPHAKALEDHLMHRLQRPVTRVGPCDRPIRQLAWCSGGAQNWFEDAIAQGVDAFVTGEISEPQMHLAQETNTVFIACGHHATERYGVQAVGENLAAQWGLSHTFIDIDNPA
jgi:dinuclear metal center YbgI/SA1388 family protein